MLECLIDIEHSFPVHLLQVVGAAEFFGREIGQRTDLVLLQEEVAVRAKDVVAQEIRVMGCSEDLYTGYCNHSPLDGLGDLEVIERVRPVHKDKRCVFQSEIEFIELGKRQSSGRRDAEKIRLLFIHPAEDCLPPIYRPRAKLVTQTILAQESLKVTDFARLDDSLHSFGVTPAIRRTDIHHALRVI